MKIPADRPCTMCNRDTEGEFYCNGRCHEKMKAVDVSRGTSGSTGPAGPVGIVTGIGNIYSDEKGSGARYNSNKPAMDLIPVWIVAESEQARLSNNILTLAQSEAIEILRALGDWQRGIATMPYVFKAFDQSPWEDCAKVFEYGRNKYAAWNWAKGMPWSIPVACIIRHCLAIIHGEILDPESGLPHRGHVACNLVMLQQYETTYREGNDLPTKWIKPVPSTT